MKYCKDCKINYPETVNFCTTCGKPLIFINDNQENNTNDSYKKKSPKIKIGLLCIVVLGILGFCFYKQIQIKESQLQNNKLIALAKYNEIGEFGAHGTEELALVELETEDGECYGAINKQYEEVIPCIYEEIIFFHEGLSFAELNDKYVLIDTKGYIQKHLPFSEIYFNEEHGIAVAEYNNSGDECIINYKGEKLTKEYDGLSTFSEDPLIFRVLEDGKYGLIDKSGNIIHPFIYDFLGELGEYNLPDNITYAEINGCHVLVNTKGEEISKRYDDIDIYWFRYNNMAITKIGSKYGAINKQGKEILPCLYSDDYVSDYICNSN